MIRIRPMIDTLTLTEKAALARLEQVAKDWPHSLVLMSMGGTLVITKREYYLDQSFRDAPEAKTLPIYGIPNDGGDW